MNFIRICDDLISDGDPIISSISGAKSNDLKFLESEITIEIGGNYNFTNEKKGLSIESGSIIEINKKEKFKIKLIGNGILDIWNIENLEIEIDGNIEIYLQNTSKDTHLFIKNGIVKIRTYPSDLVLGCSGESFWLSKGHKYNEEEWLIKNIIE